MDDNSVKAWVVDKINGTRESLLSAYEAVGREPLNPFSLREAARQYDESRKLEADLAVVVANYMCLLKIDEISYKPIEKFLEAFATWLGTGNDRDMEWTYSYVTDERKKLEKVAGLYRDDLRDTLQRDLTPQDEFLPIFKEFDGARGLFSVFQAVTSRPFEDQVRLRSAVASVAIPHDVRIRARRIA